VATTAPSESGGRPPPGIGGGSPSQGAGLPTDKTPGTPAKRSYAGLLASSRSERPSAEAGAREGLTCENAPAHGGSAVGGNE
jgi:hypothetical protein